MSYISHSSYLMLLLHYLFSKIGAKDTLYLGSAIAVDPHFTRRDKQLEKRFQTLMPLASTPFPSAHTMTCTPGGHQQAQPSSTSDSSTAAPLSLHKLKFPRYRGISEEQDPLAFIKKCEEFLAVRPLNDLEILAALTSVLSGMAKGLSKLSENV